jgi:hypothetical protein
MTTDEVILRAAKEYAAILRGQAAILRGQASLVRGKSDNKREIADLYERANAILAAVEEWEQLPAVEPMGHTSTGEPNV